MKIRFATLFILFATLLSCNDEVKQREIEHTQDLKKKELIFATLDKSWNFNTQPLNVTSQSLLANWTQWRELLRELSQKPQSSIGAFQKKSKALSKKAMDLNQQIPAQFDKPEIKSRIAVLITKINSLNLYINLNEIPEQKIVVLIKEINSDLISLQAQMDEIVRKSLIPKEEGESEMIRMLDTSRAVPTVQKDKILPLN